MHLTQQLVPWAIVLLVAVIAVLLVFSRKHKAKDGWCLANSYKNHAIISNGGALRLEEDALVFRAHEMNFDSGTLIIPYEDIASIEVRKKLWLEDIRIRLHDSDEARGFKTYARYKVGDSLKAKLG